MQEYDIKSIMEEIEQDLIVRMKRTLWSHKEDEKIKGFDWPQWQAMKLKQLHEYKEANKELFTEKTRPLNKYLYKHIKQQFREGASRTNKQAIKAGIIKKEDSQLSGAFFGLNYRKLDALIKSTKSDLRDVKYATLRMANDQYRQIIYKAQVYANAGAGTVKQAIDMATKDFLAKGFNCIEYKNGRRVNIADYCDMAIKTANKRANLMGEGEMRKKLGNSLVYISKHGGACDQCTPWEGRVYIDDVWSGGKEKDGKYPMLSTAIEGGLFHPRCQHGASTYYEGINDEPEVVQAEHNHDEDDKYTQELQRRKKQYERLLAGSLFADNIKNYSNQIQYLQKEIENSKIELSDEEKEQLTNYTRFDATRINKAIRLNRIDDKIQNKIDIIDSALNKAQPLKEDITLYRGTIIQSISGFENINKVSYEQIMNLEEKFITDRAFISTSKVKAEVQGRNIVMNIKVPKGFKGALDIEEYATPKYKYQKEVLLKRNTNFYVKSIKYNQNDKKYYFDIEVIE